MELDFEDLSSGEGTAGTSSRATRTLDLSDSESDSLSPVRKRPRYRVPRDLANDFSTELDQRVEYDLAPKDFTVRHRRKDDMIKADSEIHSTVNGTLSLLKSRKRDAKYYFEDGSCILLVEDTLFNVHRTILSRDCSSFSTMFSLPQGNHEVEGKSDENPIILTGDSVEDFRHFLWALYALPPELQIVHSPTADLAQLIDRLIAIATISSKYSFKSLETWALDAIQEYVGRKPSPILAIIPPPTSYTFSHHTPLPPTGPTGSPGSTIESTAQLTRLIRLAQMCNHERLLSTMISLLRQLMSSSLQYAYLAMTLSDELNLRALKGAAYLEVMHKAVIVTRGRLDHLEGAADGTKDRDDDVLVVNRTQQIQLLSGYYRLTAAWERLRTSPPHFDHSPSCGATWHQHGCTQSWMEFWKEKTRSDAVLALGLADVCGRLGQVAKEFDRWGSATYMHHQCRMTARGCIQEEIKKIEEALPDYFSEGDE